MLTLGSRTDNIDQHSIRSFIMPGPAILRSTKISLMETGLFQQPGIYTYFPASGHFLPSLTLNIRQFPKRPIANSGCGGAFLTIYSYLF